MRVTLADGVYESVKALIMDHALAPGGRVTIDALARQLGVSPTPVREALARLESDGLVRKRPLAGYTTTPLLTRAEFEELFEMRMLLEPAAAQRAAAAGLGAADTALLRKEADLPDPPPGTNDPTPTHLRVPPEPTPTHLRIPPEPTPTHLRIPPGYASFARFTAQDARFHNLLAERAGNRLLYESVVRLHAHLHLHRLDFPVTHYGISAVEHHRIVDAIHAGDPAAAATAMRAHLTASRQRHISHLNGG